MISTPWAILLCRFNDNDSALHLREFYENLFTKSGSGTDNICMVDYFRDMSHGTLDLSESQIFPTKEIGWFTVGASYKDYQKIIADEITRAAAETARTGKKVAYRNYISRDPLVAWAREAATRYHPDWPKIDLGKFYGVVAVYNIGDVDLFGYSRQVVCDEKSVKPSCLGHEMGHGYGLSHSSSDLDPVEYRDPWDIMSAMATYTAPHPVYKSIGDPNLSIGPGLNAANMDGRGWLDKSRVWTPSYGAPGVVELRPLHRRDLGGFLAIMIDQYYVEFRMKEGWDAGIPSPVVLIHYFEDNISYLMGQILTNKGDKFEIKEGETSIFQYVKIELLDIDEAKQKATISIDYKAIDPILRDRFWLPRELPIPVRELSIESLRVAKDIAIVNEKIIRTRQWSLQPILKSLADISSSERFSSEEIRKTIRREALNTIIETAYEKLDEINFYCKGVAPAADLAGHPQDGDGMQ